LPVGEVRDLMKQLGHALAAAHRLGIVHRDLKPENIYVAEARRSDAAFTVKVLDFGIAKWLQENPTSRTTSVMGSPMWMAPEQFDTSLGVSAATDIWALGLVTFSMLTGISYWKAAQGPSITLAALLAEISGGSLVSASQRAAEAGRDGLLPGGFDAWFARCVTRDPRDRFADAAQAHAALDAVLEAAAFPMSAPGPREPVVMPATMAIPAMAIAAAPPTGTAMMPAMDSGGVPPWMLHGRPAPLSAPPPRRSAGVGGLVAVGLLVVAGGAVVAGAWWSAQCDDGYHDSHGRCCRADAAWDEGRRACVAAATPVWTTAPTAPLLVAPTAPLPPPVVAPTPTPPAPETPPVDEPAPHSCVGAWSGRISENTGAYGGLRVMVRDVSASCGEWREVWENSGSTCVYRFVNCLFEEGAVRGLGISSTPRCTPRVNAMVRCAGPRMTFRESTGNGVVDSSTLRREGE
jgi:hypothetical protein